MYTTVNYTLSGIYTPNLIPRLPGNEARMDLVVPTFLCQVESLFQLFKLLNIVICSCWMNAREVISRVIHNCSHRKQNGWWKEVQFCIVYFDLVVSFSATEAKCMRAFWQ